MYRRKFYTRLIVLLFIFIYSVHSRGIVKMIYKDIKGSFFCFRRLNATHQIGCSTSMHGNIGVLQVVENLYDINWIMHDGPDPPYIALLPLQYFTNSMMNQFLYSKRINGVLVYRNQEDDFPTCFSEEKSCPNENFGLYTNKKNVDYAHCKYGNWNPENSALGMMYRDWGIPIFFLKNASDIEFLKENCYKCFNRYAKDFTPSWPLCSAELKSEMFAAANTPTCMRRNNYLVDSSVSRFCEPLSDWNIYSPMFAVNKSETIPERSIVVLAARLDSFSVFYDLVPSAHSTVAGLVTLLTVANTLAGYKDDIKTNLKNDFSNILFMIFNGESFDYIGSSRVVFDMMNNSFPVRHKDEVYDQPAKICLGHISHFIEISQMVPDSSVWMHVDPTTTNCKKNNDTVNKLAEIFGNKTKSIPFKLAPWSNPLPPASLQSFLKYDPNISGIVLTDHEAMYENRHYNSFLDTKEVMNDPLLHTKLSAVALVISQGIYKLMTGRELPDTQISNSMVADILECYLDNFHCNLLSLLMQKLSKASTNEPKPLYVCVEAQRHHVNIITLATRHLLAYLAGETVPDMDEAECISQGKNQLYMYNWAIGVGCIRSTATFTLALSPAFTLDDWKSTEYSTWTESVWNEPSIRVFLRPGLDQGLYTLIIGIIFTISAIMITRYIKQNSENLFQPID